MKRLLILLLLPAISHGQVTVVKKPTVILELKRVSWLADLSYDIINGDTSYSFHYRNNESTCTYFIRFSAMDELKDFEKGLIAAGAAESGDRVLLKQAFIEKKKVMGYSQYNIGSFKGGDYVTISKKQADKLVDAISKLLPK